MPEQPATAAGDSVLGNVPFTWTPRYRLATVLCNTNTQHASIRDDGDYCSDCLLQADLILEDDGCMAILRSLPLVVPDGT